MLLLAYSVGIASAFVLIGVAFARAMGAFRWLRDHYNVIQFASGATLVVLGLLLFFHRDWWLRVLLNRLLERVGLGEDLARPLLHSRRGDDPAGGGRSLLPRQARSAVAGAQARDNGRRRRAGARDRGRLADRAGGGRGRVSGHPDRRLHEPHGHRRPRRAHAAGFDQVSSKSALDERTLRLIGELLRSVEWPPVTYIIAEPCIDIKDRSCVDVCPVDCIHEYERILVIDPEECIDCGACEPECPVEAIFPEDALPEKWEPFVKINYAYPTGDEINQLPTRTRPSTTSRTRRSISLAHPAGNLSGRGPEEPRPRRAVGRRSRCDRGVRRRRISACTSSSGTDVSRWSAPTRAAESSAVRGRGASRAGPLLRIGLRVSDLDRAVAALPDGERGRRGCTASRSGSWRRDGCRVRPRPRRPPLGRSRGHGRGLARARLRGARSRRRRASRRGRRRVPRARQRRRAGRDRPAAAEPPRRAGRRGRGDGARRREAAGAEIEDVVDAANTYAVFVWGPERVKLEYVEHKPSFSLE